MKSSSIRNTYLLGEAHGAVLRLATGQSTPITEFLTISFAYGKAIALFASKLDAEICRQYLNRQSHDGHKNCYAVVASTDPRVGILKQVGNPPARLVVGFVLDQATGKLVVQGGLYSLMHFNLHTADQEWLLNGGRKPSHSVIESVHSAFSGMGVPSHMDELTELDSLDDRMLVKLAETAIQKIGSLPIGNPAVPAVFSPRRQDWVTFQVGGGHGTR